MNKKNLRFHTVARAHGYLTLLPTHPIGTPIECGASNCGVRFNLHTLVERLICPSCRGDLELP